MRPRRLRHPDIQTNIPGPIIHLTDTLYYRTRPAEEKFPAGPSATAMVYYRRFGLLRDTPIVHPVFGGLRNNVPA